MFVGLGDKVKHTRFSRANKQGNSKSSNAIAAMKYIDLGSSSELFFPSGAVLHHPFCVSLPLEAAARRTMAPRQGMCFVQDGRGYVRPRSGRVVRGPTIFLVYTPPPSIRYFPR